MCTMHALVIGIDDYHDSRVYGDLFGCVADAEAVIDFLRSAHGSDLQLTPLLEPRGSSGGPVVTYEAMVDAFRDLTGVVRSGDQVHVHYSGHGGQVPTAYPEVKPGSDVFDETLVPADIANDDARHLRDLELAYLLSALVAKDVRLTLVLDSCHAGGANRNGGRIRAGREPDRATRDERSLVADRDDLVANWLERSGGGRRPASGWLASTSGYVLLAACLAEELAGETGSSDAPAGLFSSILYPALAAAPPATTYAEIGRQVLVDVSSRAAQHPVTEGETAWTVSGA